MWVLAHVSAKDAPHSQDATRRAMVTHEAPLELFRIIKVDANERAEHAESVTDGCFVYYGHGALDLGTKAWGSWFRGVLVVVDVSLSSSEHNYRTRLKRYSFYWPLDVGHVCCYLQAHRRRQSTEEDVAGGTCSNIGDAERCCACSVSHRVCRTKRSTTLSRKTCVRYD